MTMPSASRVAAVAWDRAAQGWNDHAPLIRAWLQNATAAMLDAAQIESGYKVLDVAAGSGDQTLEIARRVGPTGSVLATDLSPRFLELAADNLDACGFEQVRFRVANAEALGLAGAGFDAAVCRLGLMFCRQPLNALHEIRQALVAGGRFSALVFSQPSANPCITTMMRTALRHAGMASADSFAPGSLLSLSRPGLLSGLLERAGFVSTDVTAMQAPFHAPRCADYVEFVRSSGSPVVELLDALPLAAREDAWADIAQQLERYETERGWTGPNELLLCSGRKPFAR